MGERPGLWAKLKLDFIVQAGVEFQDEKLLRILQLKRLHSLEYLRLECRLPAKCCPCFLQIVDNHSTVRQLSLQMDQQRTLPEEILVNLAAALVKFEEVDLFFFTDPDEPLHYAAIESNRELTKSLKVIALHLLIFGPNMIILFLTCVKP